ncbi:hypothetical protein SVA_3581 [Sulfurifustis variabilis]|uniref:DUF3149 domain-containing protein n=1 Tax=Sulfurifustis variabilis TaxID=1675686 RepID=A0A1B4VGX4_9GAMM|nr:DUF3149 domain-containing protein [Sulfurifustis variabilis]BAU50117.1 hypothetical protein SVA_3581 [Sulfurifustis variabilis]
MPILNELFGTWIGWLSMLTIAFIIGMATYLFFYVRREMKRPVSPRITERQAKSFHAPR